MIFFWTLGIAAVTFVSGAFAATLKWHQIVEKLSKENSWAHTELEIWRKKALGIMPFGPHRPEEFTRVPPIEDMFATNPVQQRRQP